MQMPIEIDFENSISDLKLGIIEDTACPQCSSTEIKRVAVDDGYATSTELGRPGGAKGKDLWHVEYHCSTCKGIFYHTISVPASCEICKQASTYSLYGDQISEKIAGIYDHIPGLPTRIALCDNPDCLKKLKTLAEEKISDGFYE